MHKEKWGNILVLRHADLRVSSCSLLNPAHVTLYFRFLFFFLCLHLLCHFRFAPFASRDNSFRSKHTRSTPAFQFFQLSGVQRTQRILQLSRASFGNKSPSSQVSRLRSVSSSLRGLNDARAGRRLVDLCF